jgi:WD40 repeat protein
LPIRVVAPRAGSKPEPVSRRLEKTLIHNGRQALIGTVLFDPGGKWIAGCGLYCNGGIQTWGATTGKQLRHLSIPDDYMSQYNPLPSPPDGHTLYVPIQRTREIRIMKNGHPAMRREVDGEIQVWELTTGRQLPPMKHTPPRGVLGIAVSSNGNWVASVDRRVTDDGERTRHVLALWDVGTRTARALAEERLMRGPPSFAPDGKTLAARYVDFESRRSLLVLWDLPGGKKRTILHPGPAYYGVPVFSPDGRYLAVDLNMPKGQAPEVKLWDVASGKEIGSFTATEQALSFEQLAFSPDGRRLAAATMENGKVFLYDVQGRTLLWTRDVQNLGMKIMLRDPVFSPDGKCLAVPGQPIPEGVQQIGQENPLELPQPRVFLFDLAQTSEPEVVVAPHGLVGRVAFSGDSRKLALGGYGCVWLFDMGK